MSGKVPIGKPQARQPAVAQTVLPGSSDDETNKLAVGVGALDLSDRKETDVGNDNIETGKMDEEKEQKVEEEDEDKQAQHDGANDGKAMAAAADGPVQTAAAGATGGIAAVPEPALPTKDQQQSDNDESDDTENTDQSAESEDDGETPAEVDWETFHVKLVFLNGDKGQPEAKLNDNVRRLMQDIKNITAVVVVENGGKTKEVERGQAIDTPLLRDHWICKSFSFGNDKWDGISIYYNKTKIVGEPSFSESAVGHYYHMKATIKSSGIATTDISVTAVHMPYTRRNIYEAFNILKDHWNAEKWRSDLAVLVGDFNRTISYLTRIGIVGFPAFKPGYLPTRAEKKPGYIDNAISNITRYKRSKLDIPELYHQVGIVRYKWVHRGQQLV